MYSKYLSDLVIFKKLYFTIQGSSSLRVPLSFLYTIEKHTDEFIFGNVFSRVGSTNNSVIPRVRLQIRIYNEKIFFL